MATMTCEVCNERERVVTLHASDGAATDLHATVDLCGSCLADLLEAPAVDIYGLEWAIEIKQGGKQVQVTATPGVAIR